MGEAPLGSRCARCARAKCIYLALSSAIDATRFYALVSHLGQTKRLLKAPSHWPLNMYA